VSTNDGDANLIGCPPGIGHDLGQERLIFRPGRQHQEQDPAWPDPTGGNVVAGHVDGQPANAADGPDDGIHVDGQDIIPYTGQSNVFTKGSAKKNVRIVTGRKGKDSPLKYVQREFRHRYLPQPCIVHAALC
jgi:hypothetical protein